MLGGEIDALHTDIDSHSHSNANSLNGDFDADIDSKAGSGSGSGSSPDPLPIAPLHGVSEREMHLWAAEGLAYSCWLMYADQGSGLAPEVVRFLRGGAKDKDETLNERGKVTERGEGERDVDLDLELEAALEEDMKNARVDSDSNPNSNSHKQDDASRILKTKLAATPQDILESAPEGRWVDAVREWVESGEREHGGVGMEKPPGVREKARPMPGEEDMLRKDYVVKDSRYLLRPEVRRILLLSLFLSIRIRTWCCLLFFFVYRQSNRYT